MSFPRMFVSVFLFFCFQNVFSDSILTKDHKIHQGHITYEGESKYVLTDAKGEETFNTEDILGVYYSDKPYDKDDEVFRLYRERALQISHQDIWERFDLAQFCLNAGLYEEAAREFRALIPSMPESSQELEKLIQRSEENDFKNKLNKVLWYSEIGHQEEKAMILLENLRTEYPDYSARLELVQVQSKVERRLNREKFREGIKGKYASFSTSHFRVYAEKLEEARTIGEEAQRARSEIVSKLLFEKKPEWENPCEIFVFENEEDYVKASGLEDWSIASSLVSFDQDNDLLPFNVKRFIIINAQKKDLIKIILTHEIAHLLIRDRVGLTLNLPPWISEGFAQYFHSGINTQTLSQRNAFPPYPPAVYAMAGPRYKKTSLGGPAVQISTPSAAFPFETLVQLQSYPPFERAFYEESAGLTRFLIQRGGVEKFVALAYLSGAGKPLKEALREIYPDDFKEIEDLIYQFQENSRDSGSKN